MGGLLLIAAFTIIAIGSYTFGWWWRGWTERKLARIFSPTSSEKGRE